MHLIVQSKPKIADELVLTNNTDKESVNELFQSSEDYNYDA